MNQSDLTYIDIHAHLDFPDFDTDREQVIKEMAAAGIGAINVGTDVVSSGRVVELANRYAHLWAIVGIHPHEAADPNIDFDRLAALAAHKQVVAIGECGLDYFRLADQSLVVQQKKLFERQIELALKLDKPLMLHIRDSYQDVLDILRAYPNVRTHAHFFAGDWAVAKSFLDRGDSLSFTGVISFANQYDEVIKRVPLDRLLAETDSPFVAPVPFRGRRNDPTKVVYVAKHLAELRDETEAEVYQALLANARRIFRL